MNKTIYALGFFDGVHVGHAALLDRCKTLAREENYRAGVVTFAAHPDTLVLGNTPPLINTPYDREKLLRERFSMEQVVTLPFDEQMHTMPWQDFLNMLIRDYAAAGFVCGEDFRFGYRGEGNADALEGFCREQGLVSAVVNDQMIDGIRVSSTYIRRHCRLGTVGMAGEEHNPRRTQHQHHRRQNQRDTKPLSLGLLLSALGFPLFTAHIHFIVVQRHGVVLPILNDALLYCISSDKTRGYSPK